MAKQISTVILNTEKKLCKLLLDKELLTTYRNVKRYPEGFNVKFNFSLCANNSHIQKYCKTIITLIAVFCKLYVFRQNLDNFNILVESLYKNMLHD